MLLLWLVGQKGNSRGGGTVLEVWAPTLPTRTPERLDTLDGLAAGWLMRFGPNTRDAYARDLRITEALS